jgi:glutathione S-transferase
MNAPATSDPAITLYGHPFSRAHRVMWMLKELGIAYNHVPTPFTDGSTHQPEFLKVNPNGRVPALSDGEQTFFESLAINLYLARKFCGPLAPRDLTEEGLVTQWSFWVVTEIEKPMLLASANAMLFAEGSRRADELAAMVDKLDRPFKVLNDHLSGRDWLVGDRFTVADLNVSAVMTLGVLAGLPIDCHPRLWTWLQRCIERPAAADWKVIRFSVPRPEGLAFLKMFV